MSFRVGHALVLSIKPRRDRVAPRRARDGARHLDALAHLGRVLSGLPWMVVSGLAVPLHLGRFYREHHDIDIGVPEASLDEVATAMGAGGYFLTRRIFMTYLGGHRQVELHRRLVRTPRLPLDRTGHLRFWRNGGGPRAAPYVDVFPYRLEDGSLRILGGDVRIPLRPPLWETITLPGGIGIPVETMHHLRVAKRLGGRPIDELDRRMLRRHGAARG